MTFSILTQKRSKIRKKILLEPLTKFKKQSIYFFKELLIKVIADRLGLFYYSTIICGKMTLSVKFTAITALFTFTFYS